jgi:hypothetical protein
MHPGKSAICPESTLTLPDFLFEAMAVSQGRPMVSATLASRPPSIMKEELLSYMGNIE